MARYQLTAPDGSVHEVTAPDTASQDEVMAYAQQQFANQPKPLDPTAGMSTFDKFTAGMGKAVHDTGLGLGQIARSGLSYLPGGSSVSDSMGLPTQADIDAARQLDAPLMNTGAGMAGNLAGNVGMAVLPATGVMKGAQELNMLRTADIAKTIANPNTYKAAATVGALQGATQPVGTGDSRGFNMIAGAVGGMGGNALANGISRVVQPVANTLSAAGQKAVSTLRSAGVPLDAAQMTGSPFLDKLRSSFLDNPFTMGAQKDFMGSQQKAFNHAVLGTIGANSDIADQATMGAARDNIGNIFDTIASRNPILYDNHLNNAIDAVRTNASNELTDAQMGVINRQIDNVLNKVHPQTNMIDGQAYQNIKTGMDRLSGGADQAIGFHARSLREVLDDALERSSAANPGDYESLLNARQQWGNMKKIESAIDLKTGDISPSILSNTMKQKANRAASIYGRGNQEIINLANSGKRLLPDANPNSGTASRIAMQVALPVTAAAANGVYSGVSTGDWGDAAMGAVKTFGTVAALPKIAQKAMNSPAIANYLANGIGSKATSNVLARGARSVMLAPQTNALVGGTVRRLPNAFFNEFVGAGIPH